VQAIRASVYASFNGNFKQLSVIPVLEISLFHIHLMDIEASAFTRFFYNFALNKL